MIPILHEKSEQAAQVIRDVVQAMKEKAGDDEAAQQHQMEVLAELLREKAKARCRRRRRRARAGAAPPVSAPPT
jgi:hypothetical protein